MRVRSRVGPLPRRSRRFLTLVAWIGAVALAGSALVTLLLRWVDPPTSAYMIGDRIAALGSDEPKRQLHFWVDLEHISPHLAVAVLASEDQRFLQHRGFDFESIGEALESAWQGRRLRGASTISQQVARNLFLWPSRSVVRKGLEAWFTVLIETFWPKRRILETYLNVAEFAPGVFGAAAASYWYFNRLPERLTPEQAALMAATLPAPSKRAVDAPSLYLLRRQQQIRREMRNIGDVEALQGL